MNEATVLAKAGEGAGRAVGTGIRAARLGTVMLSTRGLVAAATAAKTATTTARAAAARHAAAAATVDLSVPRVRRGLARRIDPRPRRRRWPLVVAGLVALAAAAAARRPVAPPPAPFPPTTATPTRSDAVATSEQDGNERPRLQVERADHGLGDPLGLE